MDTPPFELRWLAPDSPPDSDPQPILWWSPDPRCMIFPEKLHISRSLRRQLRQEKYVATLDTAFAAVVEACAAPRRDQTTGGTWITKAVQRAYSRLHRHGYAHSIEIRMQGKLVGGLYGVALGGVFFGESMFSRRSNASKIALACLVKQLQAWNFGLLDCQIPSEHLQRLGAVCLPRTEFLELLAHYSVSPNRQGRWQFEADLEF